MLWYRVCLCLSVGPCVTLEFNFYQKALKKAKHKITQTTRHNSLTVVFVTAEYQRLDRHWKVSQRCNINQERALPSSVVVAVVSLECSGLRTMTNTQQQQQLYLVHV